MTATPRKGVASHHPARGARVIKRTALHYSRGEDPSLDRPSHVRAGSALAMLLGRSPEERRLAVVQDDACFVAIINPKTNAVKDIPFEGVGNLRQFDDSRGNKKSKLDLEAAFGLILPSMGAEKESDELLIALGSGSSPVRERFVLVESPRSPAQAKVSVIQVAELYAAMRANTTFSGSELNIEGAVPIDDDILFFQRGNGAPSATLGPVDATARVARAPLLRRLRSASNADKYEPALENVVVWDLGAPSTARSDGASAAPAHRLTFTDGALTSKGKTAFLACAEDSPDATKDGPVSAVAIGVLDDRAGVAELGLLFDEHGAPLLDKAEGLAFDPDDPKRAFVVTDRDDPTAPCELLELRLGDAW